MGVVDFKFAAFAGETQRPRRKARLVFIGADLRVPDRQLGAVVHLDGGPLIGPHLQHALTGNGQIAVCHNC